jgi:hypothetical protein
MFQRAFTVSGDIWNLCIFAALIATSFVLDELVWDY